VFSKALTGLLSQPYAKERSWTDNTQFIRPEQLAETLWKRLGERPEWKADGLGQEFLPNPRYRGELPAEDVETLRRRLEAGEHFLPASRGIGGWRSRLVLQRTHPSDWLKHTEHGLVVVTGPEGSEKSAVMGRITTLSDQVCRAQAECKGALAAAVPETLPPVGIINMSVHSKGKTLFDSIGAVAAALDIALTNRDRGDPKKLIEAAENITWPVALIFDDLDEAKSGHPYSIGARLIKPLAALSKARLPCIGRGLLWHTQKS
jgi:hypothetical protein